jgi:hypothetical protein
MRTDVRIASEGDPAKLEMLKYSIAKFIWILFGRYDSGRYLCTREILLIKRFFNSMNDATFTPGSGGRTFKFTTYNNVRDQRPAASVDEGILVDIIRDNQSLVQQTAAIRAARTAGDTKAADMAKRALPGFTPHALFDGPRKTDQMLAYTGLAFIDVDHLTTDEVEEAFSRITALGCTRLAWRSVSGLGIHVLVALAPLNDTPEAWAEIFGPGWTESYVQACQFYAREAGVEADAACKDPARFCFINHDPQVYYNPDALPLVVYLEGERAVPESQPDFSDRNDVTALNDGAYLAAYREACSEYVPLDPQQDAIEAAALRRAYDEVRQAEAERLRKAKKKPLERDLEACAQDAEYFVTNRCGYHFVEGQRNNFIFCFACEMNRYRILLDDTINCVTTRYAVGEPGGLTPLEVQHACVSAYRAHSDEYGVKTPRHQRRKWNSYYSSSASSAPDASEECAAPEAGDTIPSVSAPAVTERASAGDGKRRPMKTAEELYAALEGLCELRYNVIRESLELRPTAKLMRLREERFAAEMAKARRGRASRLSDRYDEEGWCLMTDRFMSAILVYLRLEEPRLKEADLRTILMSYYTPDYDPVLEYFEALPEWDGVDRVSWLFDYLPLQYASDEEHAQFRELFHKYLLGSVRCVLGGPYNELVLVLNGGESAGKTRFSRLLTPPALKGYGRDLQKSELGTKDGRIAMGSNFHIRLDEIQGMTQQEFHVFNAAATAAHIDERHAYARAVSSQRRRCTFVTTTNKPDFVRTPNGSRRCLILTFAEQANIEYLEDNFDIDQLYAQLYKESQTEAEQYPTPEEVKLVTGHNFSICTIRERDFLPQYYREVRRGEAGEWHTSSEILDDISPRFGNVKLDLEMLEEVLSRSGFERKFAPSGWAYYIKKKSGMEREADKGWNPYNE